jgi:hypothetical protein
VDPQSAIARLGRYAALTAVETAIASDELSGKD